LAQQIARQIRSTPDRQVRVPIRQLASLGAAALRPLVEATASERAIVAEAARQQIDLAFGAYQVQLRGEIDDETADELVILATALAENVDRYGIAGKQWAERLALRMIDHVDQFSSEAAASLLSQCSQILDAVPPQGPRQQTVRTAIAPPTRENPLGVSPRKFDLQKLTVPLEQDFTTSQQQGSLARPISGAAVDGRPESQSQPTTSPSREFSSPAAGGATLRNQRPPLSGNASLSVKVLTERAATTVQVAPRSVAEDQVVEVPTPAEMQRLLREYRQMSTDGLLNRYTHGDRFVAGVLRVVLAERGMRDAELEMALRTKSADRDKRLQLVEEVSSLPAAAARRLLRMLLRDDDGEVRLQALTVLATTNDPGLDELARRMAVEDNDPRVAEFATRLLRR
jgi:hypothetical protein